MAHGRVERGMLVVWLVVLLMLMRSGVVLMRSTRYRMRQQTVLVETGGIHSGKDGGRRGVVGIGRCDDDRETG